MQISLQTAKNIVELQMDQFVGFSGFTDRGKQNLTVVADRFSASVMKAAGHGIAYSIAPLFF
jgi:hypothetical protein